MAARQQQSGQPIAIQRFFSGLVTQRNPLVTPIMYMGLNLIERNDALIGGLNSELSVNHTLQRRPGFPRYCTQQLGLTEIPLAFDSARINGSVVPLLDTTTAVYSFTTSALTNLFTKTTTAQTFFQQVGNKLYMSNGTDLKKWNGTTTTQWGIAAPATEPTVAPPGGGGIRFWGPGNSIPAFFLLLDMSGQVQQAVSVAATTGTTYPSFAERTGQFEPIITDGLQTWRALGLPGTWTANQVYPGGPVTPIIDSNGNFQLSTSTGTTGATAPAWSTTLGATTTDNTISWECCGPSASVIFNGYGYCYAYHTTSGHVSTSSTAVFTGPVIGSNAYSATIGGAFSTDTQCDQVWIFRTVDGGSLYYFLGQVANNSGGGTWSFTDTTADSLLNNQIIAPIAHANDRPPTGMTVTAFHMGRIWGAVGNLLYFDAGPDTITGVPEEAWPPANVFTLPTNVTGLVPTSQGLMVFTKDQLWVILGGPDTLSFYPQQVLSNFGISSPNCMSADGDQLFVYTSSRQFFSFSLTGKQEDGFNIGDLLTSTFNPTTSYVTVHRNGTDVGVFLSDGSTNMLRYDINANAWCPLAQPIGGCGAIGSVETAFGTYGLMLGRPTGNGFLLERNITNFVDDSATYQANFTVGSIVVSEPGFPPIPIKSIVLQYTTVGSPLTVGVLMNEITGSFTDIPATANDPWQLPASASIVGKRHDLLGNQQAVSLLARHMQVQITMPFENAKNELLGLYICPETT